MKETYIDEMDLNMYRIQPAPPKWDLQEYIVAYLKEQDERYLAWFLHYYEKTLSENNLTCLMITHNMQSALDLGNRTIMMNQGKVVMDVSGEERKSLTVPDLLLKFKDAAGKELDNDRMLLI